MANRGRTELQEWIDQQYANEPKLRERVKELMAEMEIEQQLVALREARRVSQHTLAKVLGVSQPAIAKLEAGRTKNRKLGTIVRYVGALGGGNQDQEPNQRNRGEGHRSSPKGAAKA